MLSNCRIALVLLLSLGLVACETTEHSTTDGSSPDPSPNRIVVSALSAPVDGLTAYDLVSQYKTRWLWTAEPASLQNEPEIQVYVDNPGSNVGSVSALRRISAINVASIEYFPPRDAQFRFGIGNSVGAILVHMRDGS